MDWIKRLGIFTFSSAVLVYLGYLFQADTVIIQEWIAEYWNLGSYIVLGIIFLYFLLCYAIKPMYFKKAKLLNIILGLVVLLIWHQVLVNDTSSQLYIGDIITVVGIIVTFVGGTNLIVSQKVKQQKEDAEIEIIEV